MTLDEFIRKIDRFNDEALVETFAHFCDQLKEYGKDPQMVRDLAEFGCFDYFVDFEMEDGFGTEGFAKGEL